MKKIDYALNLTLPYNVYFSGTHGISIDPSDCKRNGAADKRCCGATREY